jgi:transcriptional regulator with XRE-family HTH domain
MSTAHKTTAVSARFGPLLEVLRQQHHLTLREFCRRAECDPANISRLERGLMPPPRAADILEKYAHALGLKKGSDEWYQFFDFAAADHGMMPADIMNDTELVKALPTFFRTLRGQKPTADEMRRVAEKIRKSGK